MSVDVEEHGRTFPPAVLPPDFSEFLKNQSDASDICKAASVFLLNALSLDRVEVRRLRDNETSDLLATAVRSQNGAKDQKETHLPSETVTIPTDGPDSLVFSLDGKDLGVFDSLKKDFSNQVAKALGSALDLRDAMQDLRAKAALSDTVTEGWFTVDDTGKIIRWSEGAERLIGVSSQHVLGKSVADVFRDTDLTEELVHRIRERVETEDNWVAEVAIRDSDGKKVHANAAFVKYETADSRSVGVDVFLSRWSGSSVFGTGRRVGEHVVDQIHDALIGTDMQGFVTSWNRGAEELFGVTTDQALGRHVRFVYLEEDQETLGRDVLDPLLELGSYQSEVRMVRSDGEIFWAHLTLSVVKGEDGEPIGIVRFAMDVTARKKAEDALRESQDRLTETQRIGKVGSWALDLETGNLEWSEGVFTLFGVEPYSFPPTFDWLIQRTHPDDRAVLLSAVEEAQRRKSLYSLDFRILHPDGSIHYVHADGEVRVAQDGEVTGMVGSVQDITARKRIEAELDWQKQELARSNQDLQRFAYIASHDLQEPLRTVTNFVQLLDTRYADQLDDQAREFIGFAVDGTKRMQLLITDLLAYSRVQDSKTVRKELPLEEVVQDVMADLSNTIREVGATITYNDLPVVRGDATQLRQLLRNLVANALKFRGEAPPTIEIKGEDRIGEWMVSVTDNGIGIEKKFFERIFAVFQRLHTRDEYEGTGMGLALCKVVVERHGGRIWLDSQLGKGSTFHFTISKSPAVGNFVGGRFLGTPF